MTDRPVILVTNDDGVLAAGVRALRNALLPLGHVVVVAPTREQSASSHSITIDRPLRHIEHEKDVHSIDGTPADCIYLALFEKRFLPRRPDIVLSGINHGSNLGTAVFYSGTVAGAREAAIRGIPAMAFSAPVGVDLEQAAAHSARMAERFLKVERPEGQALLLNVNFPKQAALGVKVTRTGTQIYEEHVMPRHDPAGREYFWIGGRAVEYGQTEGTDTQAVAQGYAAITPLELTATRFTHLASAAFVAEADWTQEAVS
jgi:5'-nucleotidase